MVRVGPSRSRKSRRDPSTSQQQARGRHLPAVDDDDDDDHGTEDGQEEDSEMEVDGSQARTDDGQGELNRKACDLVRLALFTEHKRIPLRREDITKKVLGSNTRSFNAVFEKAQKLLRKTFAMELVELQARNYREQEATPGDDLQEARNATGVKKKATAAGSKTYILRSVLDIAIIEQAAVTDERLLEEQIAEGPNEDYEDDIPRNYGSIISWSSADQLAALGLLHVILALILVNGRSMSDLDLRANLKRLHLPSNASVTMNARSTHRSMPIDTYLSQLIRQGYLDRARLGDSKVAVGKRGRGVLATQVNADDNQAYEWRWGNRSYYEIGEQEVATFVAEFMVDRAMRDAVDEDDEEYGAPTRGRGRGKGKQDDAEKKLTTVLKAIERAAGGNLAGIK
ncbi:MAGE-domain-containing protein [Phlebopus sp. FC_14]|nr:MAGE-domain-containing protein [Phlebopus sp. FC_14]